MDYERRKPAKAPPSSMSRELNNSQAATLVELEHFGWELKFIRHPPFLPIVPVVFDPDRTHCAVLRPDGTLDEHPSIKIRQPH